MGNLFDNPTTLRDPEHFVGRTTQLAKTFGLIEARQSVSLVGLPRIGKTSLLTCLKSPQIQQQFAFDGSRFPILSLDLQRRSMKKEIEFFDDVHRTLREHAQAQGYVIPVGLDEDDEVNALLDAYEQQGLHPVLVMDTFDEINQYLPIPEKVFSFLRSLAMAGHLSYITASVETIVEIFRKLVPTNSKPSPLYNIFSTVRLAALTPEEAHRLLINTSVKGGLPFSEKEVDRVIELAGLHPFLLQRVASQLFEEKQIQANVDYRQIEKEARQYLSHYFEDCWAMLSNSDRQAVIEDIIQFEGSGQPGRNYPELCSSKLFCDYLRETGKLAGKPLPRMNASDIEASAYKEILKSLNNKAALGECALIHIPLIRMQIERQQANHPVARGEIVQQALKEALRRMKGPGEHSDMDRSWEDYNILYYHYEKGMSPKTVAKRLAISERKYYRLFPKALEHLRSELLAMDAAVLESRV